MEGFNKPLKFKTAQDLQNKINAYFKECKLKEIPLSITGLALALDTNRQTLINYQNKDGYENIIDRAKLMIENAYEIRLINNGRSGDIFALKNFGWTDRQEIENNVTINNGKLDELLQQIEE